MTEENKLNTERSELNTLIDKGVNFDVERTIYVRQNGFLGYFKKRYAKTETLNFTIKEPTLSVLDLMSAEQIDIAIDENTMSSDSGIQEAKKMAGNYGEKLAKIVAIAVLGQDYIKTKKTVQDLPTSMILKSLGNLLNYSLYI